MKIIETRGLPGDLFSGTAFLETHRGNKGLGARSINVLKCNFQQTAERQQ